MEKKLETKLELKAGTVSTPKKLSYEELENVCHQLSAQAQQLNAQNQQLRAMVTEANLSNLYKRLDYLFEIIKKYNPCLSTNFKMKCVIEIETLMATPEAEDTQEESPKEE